MHRRSLLLSLVVCVGLADDSEPQFGKPMSQTEPRRHGCQDAPARTVKTPSGHMLPSCTAAQTVGLCSVKPIAVRCPVSCGTCASPSRAPATLRTTDAPAPDDGSAGFSRSVSQSQVDPKRATRKLNDWKHKYMTQKAQRDAKIAAAAKKAAKLASRAAACRSEACLARRTAYLSTATPTASPSFGLAKNYKGQPGPPALNKEQSYIQWMMSHEKNGDTLEKDEDQEERREEREMRDAQGLKPTSQQDLRAPPDSRSRFAANKAPFHAVRVWSARNPAHKDEQAPTQPVNPTEVDHGDGEVADPLQHASEKDAWIAAFANKAGAGPPPARPPPFAALHNSGVMQNSVATPSLDTPAADDGISEYVPQSTIDRLHYAPDPVMH